MGSGSSKSTAESPESGHRRSQSRGSKVFQSSCIGNFSRSPGGDSDDDDQAKENGREIHGEEEIKSDPEQVKTEYYRKVEDNSRSLSSRSLSSSSRFLSRFSFLPDNLSFRLSRGSSIGSSRAYAESSTSSSLSNEDGRHLHRGSSNGYVHRNKTSQGCNFFPACLVNKSPRQQHDNFASSNLDLDPSTSGFSGNSQERRTSSIEEVARYTDNNREPVGRNVWFSRTLSVGRLRDRVLHRSLFPDLLSCPFEQEDTSEASRRQAMGGGTGAHAPNENAIIFPSSSGYSQSIMSSSLYGSRDFEVESSRAREARYHDLLENRSNFLERRRRIRSQVRALQRMGSRFEKMSGHERSCVSSGQHRTGRCSCRTTTRDSNSTDGTSARASISRIVLLAEALFEVLDEIHQQSVITSSQPSLSSIGSVPAPNEVVEALPVKLFCRSEKHLNEEDAQCYICLVEYEERDSIRVLPCHHEFHRSCVDKWLKEIHRICPLCRGDICRTDSTTAENQ